MIIWMGYDSDNSYTVAFGYFRGKLRRYYVFGKGTLHRTDDEFDTKKVIAYIKEDMMFEQIAEIPK